jgi:hypothetical protein
VHADLVAQFAIAQIVQPASSIILSASSGSTLGLPRLAL